MLVYLGEFQVANNSTAAVIHPTPQQPNRWQLLDTGVVKVSVDGAFKDGKARARVVIRDHLGDVCTATTFPLQGVIDATHSEVLVIWHGI